MDLQFLRDQADTARKRIIDGAKRERRMQLNDVEDAEFRRLTEAVNDLDSRLETAQRRASSSSAADRIFSAAQARTSQGRTMNQYGAESRVYNQHTANEGRSFWRDLVLHKTGDDATGEARTRLNEHAQEQRIGLSTTGDGASFSPPVYLENLWIEAAVASKPFIAAIPEYPAPKGHTINVPKITAPGTTGVQSSELSPVTNTDQTDEFLSTVLTTVVGQQTVSRQLLDQSPIDIDSIIFKGLSQSWAAQEDQLGLYGTGSSGQYTGIANLSGITQFQSSGNSIAQIYSDLTKAIKLHWAARFLAPTTILVHPNTAAEWLNKLDTTSRPLFVPSQQGPFNAAGIIDSLNAQGPIGKILGLDLVLDPNISTTGGVESIFVFRADDLMFFTSGMRAQVHQDTLAQDLGILLSLWSYDGLIARYPNAIIEITGFPFGS
jgi:HK97 family phage major capsid protein